MIEWFLVTGTKIPINEMRIASFAWRRKNDLVAAYVGAYSDRFDGNSSVKN